MTDDARLGQLARIAVRRYVRTFVDAALRPRSLLRDWSDRRRYVSPLRVLAVVSVIVAAQLWIMQRFVLLGGDALFGPTALGALMEDALDALAPVLAVWGNVVGFRLVLRWWVPALAGRSWNVAVRIAALVNAALLALALVESALSWAPLSLQFSLAAVHALLAIGYGVTALREFGVPLKRSVATLVVGALVGSLFAAPPHIVKGYLAAEHQLANGGEIEDALVPEW